MNRSISDYKRKHRLATVVVTVKIKMIFRESQIGSNGLVMSEPDVSDLITVRRAIEILDAAEVVTHTQIVELSNSLGLHLAQDVLADRDYPAFEKSLMDGYAIRSADASRELKVVGEIRAGEQPSRAISSGEAVSIMTGAPLPTGADGVVPVEFTQRKGDRLTIARPGDFSRFIAHSGSDCAAGTTVLKRGMTLEAPQLAVAATVGARQLQVYAKPRVAILATGDELVNIDETPASHQIRNSNSIMLRALLTCLGCDVTDLGIARDEMPAILAAIERGMAFDALFITGGMSMGTYDLPPKALEQLGADIRITKLKIKPGKPFIYATLEGCQIFGLPGNPLAGFVCTVRLVSRLLRRMMGADPSGGEVAATLSVALPANGPREFYQPVRLDGNIVHPLAWKGSADVFTLAQSNALLIRAENEPPQPVGAHCRVIDIRG
jgi:molybdopterin molybdotransferase